MKKLWRLYFGVFSVMAGLSPALAGMEFRISEISDAIYGELGVVERLYPFAVVGDEVLRIGKVTSSCGCTVPALQKTEYRPGEAGELRIRFDPKGKSGPQVVQVDVETESGKVKKSQRLTYRVDVLSAVILHPEIVFWRKEDALATKEVLVRADEKLIPKTVKLKGASKHFSTELRWDGAQKVYFLQVCPREAAQSVKEPIIVVMEDETGRHFEKTLFALIR